MSLEEQIECPLCMEPLELDDINFFPCTCGYQICRFCWHRIRTDENGLCPACRKAYPEDPAEFKPLTDDELSRIKKERRQKDLQRKQKAAESRKHLANVRVVQRNLVFVVGLSQRLADPEVLKKHDYFGKFGKTVKVVINQSTSYAGAQGPSASAYITYLRSEDALRAIQTVNNLHVDGRTLKASLGTTKYCSHFLRGTQCPKPDCMYLHELGEEQASFTKDEMQQGKHQEYEQKLYEHFMNTQNIANSPSPAIQTTVPSLLSQNPIPSPSLNTSVVANLGQPAKSNQRKKNTSSPVNNTQSSSSSSSQSGSQIPPNSSKEAWPSLQSGGKETRLANGSRSTSTNSSGSESSSRPVSTSPPSQPDTSHNPVTDNLGEDLDSERPHQTPTPPQQTPQTEIPNSNASPESQLSKPPSVQPTVQTEISNSVPAASSPQNRSTPPGLTNSTAPFPQGSLLPSNPANMLRRLPVGMPLPSSHLQKNMFDSQSDSMSLFSMSGFTGANRGAKAPLPHAKEDDVVPAVEIPDSIPVSTTTDWQAAFGFTPSANIPNPGITHPPAEPKNIDPQDDDLGFDPWMESTKALADLVEKEGHLLQQQQQLQTQRDNRQQTTSLPPGFNSKQINPFPPNQCFSSFGLGQPGGNMFHSQPQASQQHPHGLHPGGMGPGQKLGGSPHSSHLQNGVDAFSMKDWQEGLRALLPNINISFSNNQNNVAQQQQQQQQQQPLPPQLQQSTLTPKSQQHQRNLPPHAPLRQNSWDISQDPAILSSGNVTAERNAEEPHWMASLHSLTEDNTNHRLPFVQQFNLANGSNNWAAHTSAPPPPGFQRSTQAEPKQLTTEGL